MDIDTIWSNAASCIAVGRKSYRNDSGCESVLFNELVVILYFFECWVPHKLRLFFL